MNGRHVMLMKHGILLCGRPTAGNTRLDRLAHDIARKPNIGVNVHQCDSFQFKKSKVSIKVAQL